MPAKEISPMSLTFLIGLAMTYVTKCTPTGKKCIITYIIAATYYVIRKILSSIIYVIRIGFSYLYGRSL